MKELTFRIFELPNVNRRAQTSPERYQGARTPANNSDDTSAGMESNGFLQWSPRSSSFSGDIAERVSKRHHRSKSLVQLSNKAILPQKDLLGGSQRMFTPPPRIGKEPSDLLSNSAHSSVEQLSRNSSPISREKLFTAANDSDRSEKQDSTRINRKMSFSSVLNRNSESFKQSRFRRASSFSIAPKDTGIATQEDTIRFESRMRIPNRRRPLSLNSYEYERLNRSSHLPSPSEETEIILHEKETKTSKLESIVKKAAAWLEDSRSMMQANHFSMATGNISSAKEEAAQKVKDEDSFANERSTSKNFYDNDLQRKCSEQEVPRVSAYERETVQRQSGIQRYNESSVERQIGFVKELDLKCNDNIAVGSSNEKLASENIVESNGSEKYKIAQANCEAEMPELCLEVGHNSSDRDSSLSEYSLSDEELCFNEDINELSEEDNEIQITTIPSNRSRSPTEVDGENSLNGNRATDASYLSAVRTMLMKIEEKDAAAPKNEPGLIRSNETVNVNGKSDAVVQCNGVEECVSPRVLSPRRFGTHKNPFEDLKRQGSIESKNQTSESVNHCGTDKGCRLPEENNIHEPSCSCAASSEENNIRKTSCTCAQRSEENNILETSCSCAHSGGQISNQEGSPVCFTSPKSINKIEEIVLQKTIGRNSACKQESEYKQEYHQGEEKILTGCMPSKTLNELPIRNSCSSSSNSHDVFESAEKFESKVRLAESTSRSLRRRPIRHRTSKSTSDIEIKFTEIQFLPSLKRGRRRLTSSGSLKLEWNASMLLNEIDVDSYAENTASDCSHHAIEGTEHHPESSLVNKSSCEEHYMKMAEKKKINDLFVEKSDPKSSSNELKSSRRSDDSSDVHISRRSDLHDDIRGEDEPEDSIVTEGTPNNAECALSEQQSTISYTEGEHFQRGQGCSVDSITSFSNSLITDEASEVSTIKDVDQWDGVECAVEAMLKNKTDDWKTANFHKICGSSEGDSRMDGTKPGIGKEESPIVYVNQDDFGCSWTSKNKSNAYLQETPLKSKEEHIPKGLESNFLNLTHHNGLGFLRDKFQKFAKWSKRASEFDSSKPKGKDKGSKTHKKKKEKRKQTGDKKTQQHGNRDQDAPKKAQNISIYDVNRNFVLSAEFVKNSKASRLRREIKIGREEKRRSQDQRDGRRLSNSTSKLDRGGKEKESLRDGKHITHLTVKNSKRHSVDDETSLTTVSELSKAMKVSKDYDDGSSITLTDSDSSDESDRSDSTLSGPLLYSTDSSSSDTINESIDKTEMPDFRSPSRIQDDLAVLLERKMTRRQQGLEEIDFHPLIPTTKGKALVSRDWLYERVHQFLLRKNKERLMLISGRHGCGKTTFLKTIVWSDSIGRTKNRIRDRISTSVLSYHFCSKADSTTTSVAKFVLNLAVNLVENRELSLYTKALNENDSIKEHLSAEAAEKAPELAFREGILTPLNEIYGSGLGPSNKCPGKEMAKQYLILVDALDHECASCKPNECITSLLSNNIKLLPSWIRLVVCGSKESLEAFSTDCVDKVFLDNVANWDTQSDLYSFTEMELPVISSEGISKAKIRRLLENVVRFSKGSFQIAHMAVEYLSSSFTSPIHQPSLQSLDVIKLVSHLFKLKFGAVERNRILALSLLDVLFVAQELPTMSTLFKAVENSCSCQQVSFQEYKTCLEKLLELQLVAESTEGKLFINNITRRWLESSDGMKTGFDPSKGHNLLSVYYMKTLTSNEGRCLYLLAYHLASSNFGEDIEDIESRVSFLAWTFSQVFKNSSPGFIEPCNIYRPIKDVYHLFLHTDLDMKAFERRYGAPPLVIASALQQTDIVSMLLDHKRFDDTNLRSAFEEACRVGNIEIIDLIYEKSGEPKILRSNEIGSKVLDITLESGHFSASMRILEAMRQGDDSDKVNAEAHQKILCEACAAGRLDIISELLDKGFVADINALDSNGNSALVCASSRNQLVAAKCLVENAADIDIVDGRGITPLLSSAMNGHLETSEWLISQDANVDAEDEYGKTPLMYAASNGLSELVHSLFMEGASLNHQDKDGATALSIACQKGFVGVVKMLLKNRAMTESTSKEKKTPLHYASERGNLKIIQLLLDNGANINQRDVNGLKPLEIALITRHLDAVALLLKYGAHVGKSSRNIAEKDLGSFLCLISHLEQRGNIMIKAGKFVEANEDFQRAMNMIETSKYRNHKKVHRIKLLCQQDARKKFI